MCMVAENEENLRLILVLVCYGWSLVISITFTLLFLDDGLNQKFGIRVSSSPSPVNSPLSRTNTVKRKK